MQVQQRFVRMPSAGIVLAVAVFVAAAFAVVAFYLTRVAVVGGTSTGSPSVTTVHQQAPDAIQRNTDLRGPVCSSSICNPNAGTGTDPRGRFQVDRWWDSLNAD